MENAKKLTKLGFKYNTDKATWHLFTEIYDDYFSKYKNPTILEIGVFKGGSLLMYDEFYNGECFIVGLDDEKRTKFITDKKNIKIVKGDQINENDLNKCLKIKSKYDIILDDGGHIVKDQQISFNYLFDHLKSGGIYIIEDLHANFNRDFYNKEGILMTIDLLEQLDKGVYKNHSPYISQKDFNRLKKQINYIKLFWKTPDKNYKNSITSIICKV